MNMKKILVGIGIILVAIGCFFFFRREEKPFDEAAFKDLVVKMARQRVETDFVPDIVIDDFPASAWLFAKKYGYEVTDVPVGYDAVLEVAEGKREGTMTVYSGDKFFELPFPDRLVSRTHYSFYTICPWKYHFITPKRKVWSNGLKFLRIYLL